MSTAVQTENRTGITQTEIQVGPAGQAAFIGTREPQVGGMPLWLSWLLRRLTKHVINPMTLRRAGRIESSHAALHHVGRKSGRPYVTPLVAEPVEGGFIIPLPYGEGTDWCRNLVAAGKGTLDVKGETILILNPRVLQLASVNGQVRAAQVRNWTRLGLRSFLHVDRATSY
jgi:deazaflavin-dependent oxidoreductase (nitroreductase family)